MRFHSPPTTLPPKEECDHDFEYAGSAWQQPAEEYPDAQCNFSGYIEKCVKCGEIWQVPA